MAVSAEAILGPGGKLKKAFPNFVVRNSQLEMAKAVEQAIINNEKLVVEAGTGTGKTFAYLVPAMLSNGKVVISTGTKNLQDQLFQKDVPLVRKALGKAIKIVLLKGRANYLCLHRLNTHAQEVLYPSKKILRDLHEVSRWSHITEVGDISELHTVPEDSGIWPYVTSTNDNCLGGECPLYAKCHLVRARQEAMKADVVIINHYLFFADLVLKDDGFGELLPKSDVFILDEAHQLPEIASQFLGERLSSRQFNEFTQDALAEYYADINDVEAIPTALTKLEKNVQVFRKALGDSGVKAPWYTVKQDRALKVQVEHLTESLEYVISLLQKVADRSKGIESALGRGILLKALFKTLVDDEQESETVHWFETFSQSFSIYITPLNISERFETYLKMTDKWIFTSATLTANQSFDYFLNALALNDAKCLHLESPFDFKNQAMLYLPRHVPDTSHETYVASLVEAVRPVLQASKGRAFLLFTSHSALQAAKALLQDDDYELLVQGDSSKQQLLEKFKTTSRAVLLGTASFWEGVDVAGDALQVVVIDKLPFGSPFDPVSQAKNKAMKAKGIDPFNEHHLPLAIISLKQGVGRLIRDAKDRGVVMIVDPRLRARDYGQAFLSSLPPMPITRDADQVCQFLEVVYEPVSA